MKQKKWPWNWLAKGGVDRPTHLLFVRRYPEYAIVLLPAPRTVGQPVIGREWRDKKKILYLFYDADQEHYVSNRNMYGILPSMDCIHQYDVILDSLYCNDNKPFQLTLGGLWFKDKSVEIYWLRVRMV